MKIHIKFPGGGEFRMEREPMSRERFQALCGVVFALIASWTVLGLFSILVKGAGA